MGIKFKSEMPVPIFLFQKLFDKANYNQSAHDIVTAALNNPDD